MTPLAAKRDSRPRLVAGQGSASGPRARQIIAWGVAQRSPRIRLKVRRRLSIANVSAAPSERTHDHLHHVKRTWPRD
jgi:hypothetical protein